MTIDERFAKFIGSISIFLFITLANKFFLLTNNHFLAKVVCHKLYSHNL